MFDNDDWDAAIIISNGTYPVGVIERNSTPQNTRAIPIRAATYESPKTAPTRNVKPNISTKIAVALTACFVVRAVIGSLSSSITIAAYAPWNL